MTRKERVALKRQERRQAKEKLAALRAELREARARRKQAIVDARERCRAERIATSERLRAQRLRVLAELREQGRAEREGARRACTTRKSEARALGDDVARARAALVAEKKLQTEMRRIAHAERARRAETPASIGLAPRSETDDEVLANIPSELAPLFDRVKRSIKPTPRLSRTESFLLYAEKHPDEVLAANDDAAHVRVRELERAEHDAKKACGCRVNPYEAKKAARLDRLRARADRLEAAAEGAYASAKQIADMIPMGQPILVGHHSEKRHRRDIDRIQGGFGKAFELQKQADELRRRAERSEQSGAISSDDPEAIPKLRAKLEQLDEQRARMVAANKAVRSKEPRQALAALGFSESSIDKILTPDPLGRIGFPSYALQNAGGEAGRLRKRIAELEARVSRPPPQAVELPGVRIDEADNRVRIFFDNKPAEAIRSALKGAGFRWAPSIGAWQRQTSNAAWYEAKRIVGVDASAPVPAPVATLAPTPMPVAHAANHNMLASGGPPPPPEVVDPMPTPSAQRTPETVKAPELRDTAQIAKRIREDIQDAVRGKRLPAAKYSVTTDKYSMGSSITMVATKLPFRVLNPDAYRVDGGRIEFDRDHFRTRYSPEAEELLAQLEAIVRAYHWDRSDSMSDYFNSRFHYNVQLGDESKEYAELEKAMLANSRASRADDPWNPGGRYDRILCTRCGCKGEQHRASDGRCPPLVQYGKPQPFPALTSFADDASAGAALDAYWSGNSTSFNPRV